MNSWKVQITEEIGETALSKDIEQKNEDDLITSFQVERTIFEIRPTGLTEANLIRG